MAPRDRWEHEAAAAGVSLTTIERAHLDVERNLADAHARQRMSSSERSTILDQFSNLFTRAQEVPYAELESDAAGAFLASLGQVPPRRRFFTLYSSSVATMVVARALADAERVVRLTSPTFDNIHDLLAAARVIVTPRIIDACEVEDAPVPDRGCVFEVSPNNPTGHFITPRQLEVVATECVRRDAWLVLDQSFKGHDARACFDHYSVLEASGASYIVIEDTGKLWPALDLKASFLFCSEDLVSTIEPIVDDVLLNVSPFILELVRVYSEFSRADDYASVRSIISTNRRHLRERLAASESSLAPGYPDSSVGVEVVDLLADRGLSWRDWLDRFAGNGLGVLETSPFFWHEPNVGRRQLRLSLCRDPAYFESGVDRLLSLVQQ